MHILPETPTNITTPSMDASSTCDHLPYCQKLACAVQNRAVLNMLVDFPSQQLAGPSFINVLFAQRLGSDNTALLKTPPHAA